jgi:hypothetical protein
MVKASQGLRIGSKPLKIKEGAPQKCGVLFTKNYRQEKVKMHTGKLIASGLTYGIVASVVSGETTIAHGILLEDENFIKFVASADSMEDVIAWAEENY